jgi:putative hydrolase of the HAD superfamily
MIFFDLDDTLLDHSAAARAGATKFFEVFHSAIDEDLEDFLARWETVAEKHFQSNNPGLQSTLWGRRRARIRELFSNGLTDEEADARFRIYLETYELNWKLFPDSTPCLQALKDYRLGLITNGEREQQRSKIQKLGLGPNLSTVIISDEVGCAKPEKAIFELAARQAGIVIQDCVYVGDRLNADALGSQKAGMRGIWLDRKGQGTNQRLEVPVIKSLKDLSKLL